MTTPVRVGIDIRVADPKEPGQQRYLWRLGAWLAAQGHEVHLLTVRAQPDTVRTPPGTTLHRLAGTSRRELRAYVERLALDVLLINPERSRRYRGLPANVLRSAYGTEQYAQKLRSFRSVGERTLRKALRVAPWVLAERSWERAYYERTDPEPEVVAQSRYMRDQILSSYRISPERVHVVHNAVDTDEFNPPSAAALRAESRRRWGVPEDAYCLLFLGHNFRLKGLWQILDVLPRAAERAPSLHLLVVGSGTGSGQRKKARRLVAAAGLESRVSFAGPVRPSLPALAAADVLLHLSWHDSFGFVVLEAMACGRPVVTTPWVGAAELVEDGRSGVIVDPASDADVVDAVCRLSDPVMRGEMAAAAAARAADHDEPGNFGRVLAIMTEAARRRARPMAR